MVSVDLSASTAAPGEQVGQLSRHDFEAVLRAAIRPLRLVVNKIHGMAPYDEFSRYENGKNIGPFYLLLMHLIVELRLSDLNTVQLLASMTSHIRVRDASYSAFLFEMLLAVGNSIDALIRNEADVLEIGYHCADLFEFESRLQRDERTRRVPDYLATQSAEMKALCASLRDRVGQRLAHCAIFSSLSLSPPTPAPFNDF